MSGNVLDEKKFANAVLYLVRGCGKPGQTKLLKMLHLADFAHYRRHLSSITGGSYVALARGPVLDQYTEHFDLLERRGILSRQDVPVFGKEKPKIEYLLLQEPDEDVFSATEREILDEVIHRFGSSSGAALSDLTHEENGIWSWAWEPTNPGRPIPYVLARWLDNRCDDKDEELALAALADPEAQAELAALRSAS